MYQSTGNSHFAFKQIAPNDIKKGALLVTADQQAVLRMAGLEPEGGGTGDYMECSGYWGDDGSLVKFTYYGAERNAHRAAEPRIGRLTRLLSSGMYLFIIWDGYGITFYQCEGSDGFPPEPLPNLPLAFQPLRVAGYSQWKRDTEVMAEAKARAGYKCEYPGCIWSPFLDAAGYPYVETHHIVPLAAGGPDILENCSALCPGCHRRAHFASPEEQLNMRQTLMALRNLSLT